MGILAGALDGIRKKSVCEIRRTAGKKRKKELVVDYKSLTSASKLNEIADGMKLYVVGL